MYRTLIAFFFIFNLTPSFAAEPDELSFNKGVTFFKQQKYKSALTHFKKAYSQGMRKSTLYFNIAVSYYKLGNFNRAKNNFKHLTKDKKFQQIAYFNLGLISEKENKKQSAADWYKKSAKNNSDKKLTRLANTKLDKLLNKKSKTQGKSIASVSLAFGNDDNITSAASNSPSNKGDNSLELFAYGKTKIANKTNLKGTYYLLKYTNISTENFDFFSIGIDHTIKMKRWKITPELAFLQSNLNGTAYQNIFDLKVGAKQTFKNTSRLAVRYRLSNINSQNAVYDYLEGQRHQLRTDYKKKVSPGDLRLRYQLEINDRQNTATTNYSPTRHTFRARLKHKLENNWSLSEELGLRLSQYGSSTSGTRNDSRIRLRVVGSKKIKKDWSAGIRYIYTNNQSNVAAEKYSRNKLQVYTNWDF